jgi:hypothetical protein
MKNPWLIGKVGKLAVVARHQQSWKQMQSMIVAVLLRFVDAAIPPNPPYQGGLGGSLHSPPEMKNPWLIGKVGKLAVGARHQQSSRQLGKYDCCRAPTDCNIRTYAKKPEATGKI